MRVGNPKPRPPEGIYRGYSLYCSNRSYYDHQLVSRSLLRVLLLKKLDLKGFFFDFGKVLVVKLCFDD